MTDTLTREPLHTALSFLEGVHVEPLEAADPSLQPLAYLYSAGWEGQTADRMPGHYDENTQTWIAPPGMPTAGIATYTNTSCYQGSDRCRDDTCA